jgi:hypothetical protein
VTVSLLLVFVCCDEGIEQAVSDVKIQNKLVAEGGEIEFGGITESRMRN